MPSLYPLPEVVVAVAVAVAVAIAIVADSDVVEVESVALVVVVVVAFSPFWNLGIKGLCQVCDYFCDSPFLS